ncbi:MAG: hypothetical protein NPIRA04_28180 [Nitrospirales bacterium]|nr:MAG: hypothetical protein NPIRA04_28180 [Nitrospirales bacterium]
MKRNLFINRTIFVASLMFVLLILPGISSADDQEDRMKNFYEAQEQSRAQIAVGSSEDTLKACLGRIPSDASAGQFMLAEQNCQHVEVDRNKKHLSF